MTLKNETERLENSSNKIKTIKTNINKELVAKGSTNANTLADIPLKIKNLKSGSDVNYAEGECRIEATGELKTYTLTMNLNFEPSFVLLQIVDSKWSNFHWVQDTSGHVDSFQFKGMSGFCNCSITYTRESITFTIKDTAPSKKGYYSVKGWMAIG